MIHINLKSTSLVHTPGIIRYLQYTHHTDPTEADRIFHAAFPVIREEYPDTVKKLLSGNLATTFEIDGDFHILDDFQSYEQSQAARYLAEYFKLPANYQWALIVGPGDPAPLCPACIESNIHNILHSFENELFHDDWLPLGWENTLNFDLDDQCVHCQEYIHPDHNE